MENKTIGKRIRDGLVGIGLSGAVALSGCSSLAPKTPFGSIEAMSGQTSSRYDLKVNVPTEGKAGAFVRNIATVDSETKDASNFSLIDLYHNVAGGLDAVYEAQAIPGLDIDHRAGLQYFKGGENSHVYVLGTASLGPEANYEVITNMGCTHEIKEGLEGFLNLETVTNFGEEGHNFSAIRPRIGLKFDNVSFGFSPEYNINADGEASQNYGFSLAFEF